jgi:ornithine--oxo-acid transaminase
MTTTEEILRQTTARSATNYAPLPIVLSRGEGAWVWDVEGNKYLDCLSAYSALNHGHRHPRIVNALCEQLGRIALTSRAFHNDRMGAFLQRFCELAEVERALPMNTGVEAVETALKMARKWGYQVKGVPPDRAEIVVCRNNFHGRTIGVVSFSTEPQYREGFGPFTPGFRVIDFGDARQLERAITPHTVAFLVEPIQGEAGIQVPATGFLTEARRVCREHRVLFILDEIQTGLGRTGKLFAYQHEAGARPDVLIVGKALGGGVYPVSAVGAAQEVMGVFKPGDHGSTFGGNPLGSAVASEALSVIVEERLAERARDLGEHLLGRLRSIGSSHVHEIRGRGLFIGIELKPASGPARPFCERLMRLGLLAKETHEQTIRIAPPLVVTRAEVDWIADAIAKVLL